VSATIRASDVTTPPDRRGRLLPWAIVVLVLVAIGIAYARLRWPGYLPVGSDNDEYQLVGSALARFEAPVVAGVEGTKYPLGYPFLLAILEWLRLPVAPAALVINVLALAASVATVAFVAGRATAIRPASPGAALAAGGLLVTSAAVWNDVFSVMPELLLLAVVTAMLATVDQPLGRRRLVVLTVLAVVAVLLKTLAILVVVGGCGLIWLLAQRDRSLAAPEGGTTARVLIPAAASIGVVLAGLVLMRPYPEHTTGYFATFPLEDPDDASLGRLSPGGLIGRTLRDVPDTLTDLGRAIALIDAGTTLAVIVAILALGLGVVAAFRLRPEGIPLGPFAAGAVVAYALGMAAWPYHSSRFGLPLVPVAALGAGWLVRMIAERGTRSLLAGGLLVALLVATSSAAVADRGDRARDELARQHAALEELERWADQELGDGERLVSFDYREVSRLLDRTVAPIGYTSDPDALLDQIGDADRLVVLDLYGKRTTQADVLLREHGDRFEVLVDGDDLRVFAVRDRP
jgi:hypothetical protein